MQSMGVQFDFVNPFVFDLELKPVLMPGTILSVPSSLCRTSVLESNPSFKPYFDFQDEDNDACLDTKAHQITWSILEDPNQDWEKIESADQLIWTPITSNEFILPPDESKLSGWTSRLKIPEHAANKRIGFTYQAVSKTGEPSQGEIIKVWDTNYFFGQLPSSKIKQPDQTNVGRKLERNPDAHFGSIFPSYTKPTITDLFMYGELALAKTIEAKFKIEPNTTSNHEMETLFWWGPKGSTQAQAHFSNPNFKTTPHSHPLTEADIGAIIEVSVLPIKKQDSLFIVGDLKTITSEHERNQFYTPPRIEKLKFNIPPRVTESVHGTYTFNNGGKQDSVDNSTYTWHFENENGQWESLGSGTIIETGKTRPPSNLKPIHAGKILKLEVTARDKQGRIGNTAAISSAIIGLKRIETNYTNVDYVLNQTEPLQFKATLYYVDGTVKTNESNKWYTDDEDVSVDLKGFVTVNPLLNEEKTVMVYLSYLGVDASITLNIRKSSLTISDLAFSDKLFINRYLTATYSLNSQLAESIDSSTYQWFYQASDSDWTLFDEGLIQTSGQVSTASILDSSFAGKKIKLEITPKNQLGQSGQVVKLEGDVETLTKIQLNPAELRFDAFTPKKQQVSAMAIYEFGSQVNVTSIGTWSSDTPVLLINTLGEVSVNQLTNQSIIGKITFNYGDYNGSIPVQIEAAEPPKITNLTLLGSPVLNGMLYATYVFDASQSPDAQDNSSYTWTYQLPNAEPVQWATGNVLAPNQVPLSPKIDLPLAGATITLEITPKDQFGRAGLTVKQSTQVEQLVNLSLTPNELRFNLGESTVKTVMASASFSLGSVIDVGSAGKWSAGHPNILVEANGNVFISASNTSPLISEVTFSFGTLSTSLPVIVQSQAADIRNLRIIGIPTVNLPIQAVYDFDAHGSYDLEDRSVYAWYYQDFSGARREWSKGSVVQSGIVPSSPILDASKIGNTIFIEVTPNDQYGRMGYTQSAQSIVETVSNIEIIFPRPEKMNSVAPTYLMAKATLSNGSIVDLTANGIWGTDNPNVISQGNGAFIVPYFVYEEREDIPITFTYLDKQVKQIARADDSNLGKLLGVASFYRDHAVVVAATVTPQVQLWGDLWLSSIRNEQNSVLSGGSSGVKCGSLSQNTCFIEFANLKTNSEFRAEMTFDPARPNDTTKIRSLSWFTNDGYNRFFAGNATGTMKNEPDLIRSSSPIYGMIFFSSGVKGSTDAYIQGVRIVYQ